MIPENFNIDDSASEKELNFFVDELLGVEKFTPEPKRLETYFKAFKDFFIERNIPIIIVAGTNGKGEVSLLLERYCLDNGLNPFVWNSPHIISVRERMSYNGHPVGAKELLCSFKINRQVTQKLSYYEFLFYIFCQQAIDKMKSGAFKFPVLILEVGLGGRLDATNFFDADLSILTSISRDHTEFLGNKLTEVLEEKMAVSRPGKILISSVEQSFLRPLIKEHSKVYNIELVDLWDQQLNTNLDFHKRNQRCAEVAFRKFMSTTLGHNDAVKINPIDHVWGRPLKMTYSGCQFILLGSHNLDGLRHLAKWTNSKNQELSSPFSEVYCSSQENFYFDEAWLGFSRQNHEELKQCLSLIAESTCIAKKVFLTSFSHPRATKWDVLTEYANSVMKDKIGKKVYLEQYFETLIQYLDSEEGRCERESTRRVLLAGSYYFLGEFILSLTPGSYQFS